MSQRAVLLDDVCSAGYASARPPLCAMPRAVTRSPCLRAQSCAMLLSHLRASACVRARGPPCELHWYVMQPCVRHVPLRMGTAGRYRRAGEAGRSPAVPTGSRVPAPRCAQTHAHARRRPCERVRKPHEAETPTSHDAARLVRRRAAVPSSRSAIPALRRCKQCCNRAAVVARRVGTAQTCLQSGGAHRRRCAAPVQGRSVDTVTVRRLVERLPLVMQRRMEGRRAEADREPDSGGPAAAGCTALHRVVVCCPAARASARQRSRETRMRGTRWA